MSGTTYCRCSHCRGFYETELQRCKYCGYEAPLRTATGQPRIFPDRATCRAIQTAEYEQLPPEAMSDPMRPPADELDILCGCLHCAPNAPRFEAVEMRWLANERFWACPCTTCGGRGFGIDIHPVEPRWECAQCGHKWPPPEGNAKPSNCKCPKCGCTEASGWFDDEYSEEDIEAMTDEQYREAFGRTREEEERELREMDEKIAREQAERKSRGEKLPWESDQLPFTDSDIADYDPEDRTGEADGPYEQPQIPDDIDFPRDRDEDSGSAAAGDNDIPSL